MEEQEAVGLLESYKICLVCLRFLRVQPKGLREDVFFLKPLLTSSTTSWPPHSPLLPPPRIGFQVLQEVFIHESSRNKSSRIPSHSREGLLDVGSSTLTLFSHGSETIPSPGLYLVFISILSLAGITSNYRAAG